MVSEFGEVVYEVKRNPWVLGVIYVNPDDRRLVVRQRSKLGWTLNMANPIAWVVVGMALGFVIITKLSRSASQS